MNEIGGPGSLLDGDCWIAVACQACVHGSHTPLQDESGEAYDGSGDGAADLETRALKQTIASVDLEHQDRSAS